jgi:hypothetical protein
LAAKVVKLLTRVEFDLILGTDHVVISLDNRGNLLRGGSVRIDKTRQTHVPFAYHHLKGHGFS